MVMPESSSKVLNVRIMHTPKYGIVLASCTPPSTQCQDLEFLIGY